MVYHALQEYSPDGAGILNILGSDKELLSLISVAGKTIL